MDENIMNAVVDELANDMVVEEAVVEAAKGFDWAQAGVKGFFIFGVGSACYLTYKGGKYVYKRWVKPLFKKADKNADPAAENNEAETEEAEVIDLREETKKQD